jgi:hypothetical protein
MPRARALVASGSGRVSCHSKPLQERRWRSRDPDVVEQRERREHVGALERAREAQVRDAVRRRAGDVLAVEEIWPDVGAKVAGEQVEERGLAGAVRADDRVQRAASIARSRR